MRVGNVGIAIGAVVGGAGNMRLTDTAWIGTIIVVPALLLTRWSGHWINAPHHLITNNNNFYSHTAKRHCY
jgi:predicted MFS family arabinose efflux permease